MPKFSFILHAKKFILKKDQTCFVPMHVLGQAHDCKCLTEGKLTINSHIQQ